MKLISSYFADKIRIMKRFIAQKPVLAALVLATLFGLGACGTIKPGKSATPANSDGGLPNGTVGKVWLLAGYDAGALFVPLIPGEGSNGLIVFAANGSFKGSTGLNEFKGTWKAGKADGNGYIPITISLTKTSNDPAPNATAARFEETLCADIVGSRFLKKERDSFRLLDAKKKSLVEFIFLESR